MIKVQSLETELPTINFIHDVYMLLLEQDYQEKAGVRERYKEYKNTTMYESLTSDVTTPNSLTQPSSTYPSFAMRGPPLPIAHNGSIYPSYNSANSSALQVMTARGVYGQVVISYQRYDTMTTCVVVFSINVLMTCVVTDLCGL